MSDNDEPLSEAQVDEIFATEGEWFHPGLSVNQLIAYNVQRARRARGWGQQLLGQKLERYTGRAWSRATVSAAESSWKPGTRLRRFDANEILAFAQVFRLPVSFFFLPPDEDELDVRARTGSFLAMSEEGEPGDPVLELITRRRLLRALGAGEQPSEYLDRLALELKAAGIAAPPADSAGQGAVPIEEVHELIEALRSLQQRLDDEQGEKP